MRDRDELRQAAVIHALRACRLFAGLGLEEARAIARLCVPQPLAKGEYLFARGEPSRGFYVVQSGAINVHRLGPAGKEQVIHVFRAGDSFAEATLAPEGEYPADARALEPSRVLLVRKAEFTELLRRHPELALRMIGALSRHLQALVEQLDDLTLKDVESRLASWLLRRCPAPPGESPCRIELAVTKRVLAAELGTVSETLSRTLAKCRDQGWIQVQGRAVTVVNPRRLAELLRQRHGE